MTYRVVKAGLFFSLLIGAVGVAGPAHAADVSSAGAQQSNSSNVVITASGNQDSQVVNQNDSSTVTQPGEQTAQPISDAAVTPEQTGSQATSSQGNNLAAASQPEKTDPAFIAANPSAAAKSAIAAVTQVALAQSFSSPTQISIHSASPVASVSVAQPAQPNPTKAPVPTLPSEELSQINSLLSSIVLPGLLSGPVYHAVLATSLSAPIFVLVLLLLVTAGGWFVQSLRRSGYAHAARSDMPDSFQFLATLNQVGFVRAFGSARGSLFRSKKAWTALPAVALASQQGAAGRAGLSARSLVITIQ